ncbi:putative lipid-binding transport protein (Tim44 family) [Roseococcus suduntuyensis]|uniref:Putative lipid-binding transport protein (Tim44 family) n=2 Tax=Roseococcus suduntuyensis TaxID=455361 RepID=A0A840AAR5_9PROT|nr:TIM44-like domain-containing protein [Roseococcus suduntuyensis]MBB3897613.1 putative lipid-binding transport protein (Tim44 family) [Roseococcus suduntuyensis]
MTALAVAAFVLAPALAEAQRARGGFGGSRGARTYQAPPPTSTAPQAAQPMQRTQQPPMAPGASTAGRPAAGAAAAGAAARPGFFARNPFMGGMMLGLFGAGIFGLLAGSGFFSGLGSLAGILGFMLQLALIAGVVMLVMAFLRRRQQPQPAGMARDMQGGGNPPPGPGSLGNLSGRGTMGAGMGLGARPAQEAPVQVGPADYEAFERLLAQVNDAWTREDMAALGRVATPEVVQYFRDDLADLAARGLKNETTDTKLEQGDLAEAWREGAREYATVAMRYSMIEVTREIASGRVVEGSATERGMGTEIWTFVRVQGGPWTLSAIQPAG